MTTHIVSGRIICNTKDEAVARSQFEAVNAKLNLALELTVCEPFGEQPNQFDLCFRGEVSPTKGADLFAFFEGWLTALGGNWQEQNMAAYQGGRYQCSAVLDHPDASIGDIAWMSLSLDPAHSSP